MDAEPNDRKIGKLCEYASRNPLRIPKITSNLEQRCFKDLRNENFGCVKAVLCIYRKLLSSCKEQMPLFASCLLGIIRALLEQTRQDEMRILGCNALVCFMGEHCHISMDFDSEHMPYALFSFKDRQGNSETESWLIGCVCRLSSTTF
ncbi:hypothetical protein ES332_D12G072700v1 [Gossypium tomentosum]|uniref:Uncharacterized protein n=1 Tax=Gossypium tomentosum TaxID=34277 RepID=A0A5D2I647_GOSTO|nr:hypothetical protein ES332_D12G072700v1 [Gossypium tomentosum]